MTNSQIDPRTPVLVGAGQFKQRPEVPVEALEPVAMMAEALAAAAQDAGAPGLTSRATHTWVVKGAWPYSDPAALLNERFGATGKTGLSTDGGNTPQSLVNEACQRISAGEADIVLIAGAEGIWSRRRARRADQRIPYTDQTGVLPDEYLGKDVVMNNKVEAERGLRDPICLYPVFESAFRASRGESMDGHRDRVSTMWEKFNQAAVANPYAWVRTPMTAEEIRNPSPSNRLVGFPYTKSMNSNWDLDLAAALIVCSAEAAAAAGVPADRWVFPHAGTDGRDTDFVSNRGDLHSSPAIRVAGRRSMELAGVDVDDIDYVDLYSCFPSAVQISATELGLGLERDLTLTGGLTFAGGPLNNYVTHSIATMANTLRENPGSIGLCSANGGYLTKHAFGIYSTSPPSDGFRHEDCQHEIDQFPSVELDDDYSGDATIEAYTVMHGREALEVALAAVRTPNGRQWARCSDPSLMDEMTQTEFIGTDVVVSDSFEFAPA